MRFAFSLVMFSCILRVGALFTGRLGSKAVNYWTRYNTTSTTSTMLKSLRPLEGQWFSEQGESWSGHALSLKVKKVLYHERSRLQEILIFDRFV